MLGARMHVRDAIDGLPVQRRAGRFLVNDEITTATRLTAEAAPEPPAGAFGVRWTGIAGDGSSQVPQQVDVGAIANEISGGLGFLTPADRAKVMALVSKFSGRQSAAPSGVGISTNDNAWARESAAKVAAEVARNGAVAKQYDDFWAKQIELNGR